MHVLHILEATAGGSKRHVLDLLVALSRRGFKCSLIYSPLRNADFERDAAFLRTLNIDTFRVPMTRGWDNAIDLPALRCIRAIICKSTFDVIHAHSSKAGFMGRLAAPRHKSTFIYTPHCIAFDTVLPRRHKQVSRFAETFLAPFTDHYIAVSQQEKQSILRGRLASTPHVSLIYNGVDTSQINATEKPNSNAPFTIGCFGRLSLQKNQEFALEVLSRLQEQEKDIKVLFVGEGNSKPQLQRLSRGRGIENAVIWYGESANPIKLYSQCDAIIQPSRWEGCPYTVLEAMACARPVLASPAGAMPHLLQHCGVIQPLFQIRRWVETLRVWKNEPQLRRDLGNAARQRVQKYFSLKQMVDETIRIYRNKF